MPQQPPTDLLCCGFTLIIDDIVRPDGTTFMQQLGGGGPQTMYGFQLISQCLGRTARLGLAAGVGADLPPECKAWLSGIGVDVSGLIESQQTPTPRAWQLFEEDGTRTQVWRVPDCPELYQQLRPTFEQLPPHFQRSKHYHLGIHASHPPMKLLQALADAAHARGGLLSVETYTCCDSPPAEAQLRELLAAVDIFSPNLDEAASIVGQGTPQQLVQRLLQLGARTVVLRMGELGVLVAQQDGLCAAVQVPAVPGTRVVDVTGCGNAFCGGFLAALDAGLDVEACAAWGCVAGSCMAEAQGVPSADVASLLPVAHEKHRRLLSAVSVDAAAERRPPPTPPVAASRQRSVSTQCVRGCELLRRRRSAAAATVGGRYSSRRQHHHLSRRLLGL